MPAERPLRGPHLIADPQWLLVLRPQNPQSEVVNNTQDLVHVEIASRDHAAVVPAAYLANEIIIAAAAEVELVI